MPVQYEEIAGFPGYRIGTDGSVWSSRRQRGQRGKARAGPIYYVSDTWRRLRPQRKSDGYIHAELYTGDGKPRYRRVHALVLEAFVGPCPAGQECCHQDGNRANCQLSNLRWGTRSQNMRERAAHGVQIGSGHHNAKLTETDVKEIRRRHAAGTTQRSIAAAFNVSGSLICNIVNRKYWTHV